MGEDEKNTRGNVLAFDKSYRKLYRNLNELLAIFENGYFS